MTSPASVGADDRLRLFLALQLPEHVAGEIAAWQRRELCGGGRIVPPGDLHVTLAFLGSRPRADLPAALAVLAAAAGEVEPSPLTIERYRETRSVGMLELRDPGGGATALALGVQAELARLGVYRREARPWRPHLTVVRFRERPRLRPRLGPPLPALGPFVPSGAAAYVSRLHPSGAVYEVLESFPLNC